MLDIQLGALKRQGREPDEEELNRLAAELRDRYDRETDIRYAAARLWVDAVIDPSRTREVLIQALDMATRRREMEGFPLGVFQV